MSSKVVPASLPMWLVNQLPPGSRSKLIQNALVAYLELTLPVVARPPHAGHTTRGSGTMRYCFTCHEEFTKTPTTEGRG